MHIEEKEELTPEELEHLIWFEEHYGKMGKKIEILTGKDATIIFVTTTKRYELKRKAK